MRTIEQFGKPPVMYAKDALSGGLSVQDNSEVNFLPPQERKDSGAISYTSVPETIKAWAGDPHGEKTLDFIASAYGIERDNLETVLADAGMGEYLRYKKEGRFVGLVATQILNPTYYFISNALALAELSKNGIPTALMVFELPGDKFVAENSDKRSALGTIEFPVGVVEKVKENGETTKVVKTARMELKPVGIRDDNGRVMRISNINNASGYRLDQIMVQAIHAQGPDGESLVHTLDKSDGYTNGNNKKVGVRETSKTYYQGVLGMDIPGLIHTRTTEDGQELSFGSITEPVISLPDFYKILWTQTISRLREAGQLPSEEEMPIFYVDMKKLYSTMAQAGQPEHAFALHEDGMMKPESYYPAQVAWPDLYLECSGCGGEEFVNKLKNAQEIRRSYGLPEKQVRLPHEEIPELDKFTIHPTGLSLKPLEEARSITERVRVLAQLKKQLGKNHPLSDKIARAIEHRKSTVAQLREKRLENIGSNDFTESTVVVPPTIEQGFQKLFEGIEEAVKEIQ